jgi:hypothetical protein
MMITVKLALNYCFMADVIPMTEKDLKIERLC